jgi:transposase
VTGEKNAYAQRGSSKVKGRKRHVAVDTLGLPIKCQVTTAEVQDRHALPHLLKAVSQKSPSVKLAFVDGGYAGGETNAPVTR